MWSTWRSFSDLCPARLEQNASNAIEYSHSYEGPKWEKAFARTLRDLSIEHLSLSSFSPIVAGWDQLLNSMERNVYLKTFTCDYINELRDSSGIELVEPDAQGDAELATSLLESERKMAEKFERFLLLNVCGRKIQLDVEGRNRNLYPKILDRINRFKLINTMNDARHNTKREEKNFKADVIYEFLRGPLLNQILAQPLCTVTNGRHEHNQWGEIMNIDIVFVLVV